MSDTKPSETITENIFRNHYGVNEFIEKSAIPNHYGFLSKKGTDNDGYPDFFKDLRDLDYAIVVEAKAIKHSEAESDIQFYMTNNTVNKDLIGIAVSGQDISQIKVTYFYKLKGSDEILPFKIKDSLICLESLHEKFLKHKNGEFISNEELISVLKELNETFHTENKIRDTDRSLFFSGLMIALTNNNFRSIYQNITAPTKQELSSVKVAVLESHNLNKAIIDAITKQLESKINNLSKEFSWADKFSFIKTIDYSLDEYKKIIKKIENKIYTPYTLDEKQDILGKAYKIFLSRAGSAENKNIILTPDHIKGLMVKLARLNINDVVLDTCTGSGGFLMDAMEKLINLANDNDEIIERIKEKQLIGFEVDSVLFALACSNMFLHGDGKTNLLYRSSLVKDSGENIVNSTDKDLLDYIRQLKPTKCIINPPYENKNPILFTKQAIEYLEPNGKLIIIMPTPTLTKNQKENGLTHEVLKIAKLDFVIKMPMNIFSEQKRTVNTSIFGFTKTPHNNDDEVLFYHLKEDGLVSIQHKGRVDKFNKWNDIESQIINSINNSKEIDGVCEKRKIYKDNILVASGVQNTKNSHHKLVKISDLFKIETGSLASDDSEDGEYDFITASSEWKKHSDFTHDCKAIIYAVKAAGSLGRTHYVNGKFIASNLCLILTPKSDKYPVNLEFYNVYFSSIRERIVSDLADGASKLTIGDTVFSEYLVEYIPKDEQDAYVKNYIVGYNKLAKQLQDAELKIQQEIKSMLAPKPKKDE